MKYEYVSAHPTELLCETGTQKASATRTETFWWDREIPELFIQQLAAHIVAATSAVISASVASKSATEE